MAFVPFVKGSMCVKVTASGNAQLARMSCRDDNGGGLLWRDRVVVERADVPDLIECLQGFVDDQGKADPIVAWPKDVRAEAQKRRGIEAPAPSHVTYTLEWRDDEYWTKYADGSRVQLTKSSSGLRHYAWECPRCHRINAPHAQQCSCAPSKESL